MSPDDISAQELGEAVFGLERAKPEGFGFSMDQSWGADGWTGEWTVTIFDERGADFVGSEFVGEHLVDVLVKARAAIPKFRRGRDEWYVST